jgi:hypothetical protein
MHRMREGETGRGKRGRWRGGDGPIGRGQQRKHVPEQWNSEDRQALESKTNGNGGRTHNTGPSPSSAQPAARGNASGRAPTVGLSGEDPGRVDRLGLRKVEAMQELSSVVFPCDADAEEEVAWRVYCVCSFSWGWRPGHSVPIYGYPYSAGTSSSLPKAVEQSSPPSF